MLGCANFVSAICFALYQCCCACARRPIPSAYHIETPHSLEDLDVIIDSSSTSTGSAESSSHVAETI